MTHTPVVSVVMPVLNGMPYLDECVRSVLRQSFHDFEFVIRDDGSTDGSTEVLRAYAASDNRIRLCEGRERLGPVGNSNWVLWQARAPLVARMDADDRSHPERLARQVEVMSREPGIDLVGTLWRGIDAAGRNIRPPDRWRLARSSHFAPFAHGSIMVRAEAVRHAGGYRRACVYWEDLDLYLRLATGGHLAVIADALYDYRHNDTASRVADWEATESAVDLMYRCVQRYRSGLSYEPLLEQEAPAPVSIETIVSVAALRLWSGGTPVVAGRIWRQMRAAPVPHPRAAASLIWALWARTNSASLRLALRALIRTRNALVLHRIRYGRVYVWSPCRRPQRLYRAPLRSRERGTRAGGPVMVEADGL